jgi:hypothetical protein
MDTTLDHSNRSISPRIAEKRNHFDFNYLLLGAFAVDLITPMFISTLEILPSEIRWVSHAILLVVIVLSYLRMMAYDHIPLAFWVISLVSVVGISASIFHGQNVLVTGWGWWRLFEFPLVGLFVYLSPRPIPNFTTWLYKLLFIILGIEVVVQIVQYINGQRIGDHLAGSFGRFGVGPLLLFLAFVICLSFGRWLAKGNWREILFTLLFGTVSSVLGAMRIFPFAVIAMGGSAFLIYALQKRNILRLLLYVAIFISVVFLFIILYNQFVPAASYDPFEEYVNPESLLEVISRYNRIGSGSETKLDVGRNFALNYTWNTIKADPLVLVFGMGVGARSESVSLGAMGIGLIEDTIGQTSRTSLLVILQEFGLFGVFIVLGIITWILITLFRDILRYPDSNSKELRYALFIFSMLWPVWLWYKTVITFRVPMMLYWVCLGYVLAEANRFRIAKAEKVQA